MTSAVLRYAPPYRFGLGPAALLGAQGQAVIESLHTLSPAENRAANAATGIQHPRRRRQARLNRGFQNQQIELLWRGGVIRLAGKETVRRSLL